MPSLWDMQRDYPHLFQSQSTQISFSFSNSPILLSIYQYVSFNYHLKGLLSLMAARAGKIYPSPLILLLPHHNNNLILLLPHIRSRTSNIL